MYKTPGALLRRGFFYCIKASHTRIGLRCSDMACYFFSQASTISGCSVMNLRAFFNGSAPFS